METLNERIKNLRKEKGWTQLQLAEKLNVTDKAVSKWEVGEANPDISLVIIIASLFGVSIDYLLTGKSAEEKVVVMSNIELCCKDDDIDRFNKLASYTDDAGVNIIEYAKKYESKKILKEIAALYAKGRIKIAVAELAPILLKLGMFDALIESKLLDYECSNYGIVATSLYYKKAHEGPRHSPCDYEAFRTPYDNRKILFDNWPTNKNILDYYFEFKSLEPKMEEYRRNNRYRSVNSDFFSDVDYSGVLYDFLQMAIDAKDTEKISYLWSYAKKYNEKVMAEYEEKRKRSMCSLSYRPGCMGNNSSQSYHLVSLSNTEVIELLKLGMIDLAREANETSHIKKDWHNWIASKVEENQFVKYVNHVLIL